MHPLAQNTFLLGDNRSVVTSDTLPHSTSTKHHNILAFHRVGEATTAKLIAFDWIQPAYNLSDNYRLFNAGQSCVPWTTTSIKCWMNVHKIC